MADHATSAMPTYGEFMEGLHGGGRVRVAPAPLRADPETPRLIREFAALAAASCPGAAPEADVELVRRALDVLYLACQFVVLRDLVPGAVPRLPGSDPVAHWSVDIALRHMPAVARLAAARSPDDPLLSWLRDTVRPWPLSAVGIALDPPADPAPLLIHAALAGEYRDRCMQAADAARIDHPAMRALVASAVGAHPELVATASSVKALL